MRSCLGILIEADTGIGRCGVRTYDEAATLAERICLSSGYTWFWNYRLSEKKILSQLRDVNSVGARSVWIILLPKDFGPGSIPTNMELDYLSEDYH